MRMTCEHVYAHQSLDRTNFRPTGRWRLDRPSKSGPPVGTPVCLGDSLSNTGVRVNVMLIGDGRKCHIFACSGNHRLRSGCTALEREIKLMKPGRCISDALDLRLKVK